MSQLIHEVFNLNVFTMSNHDFRGGFSFRDNIGKPITDDSTAYSLAINGYGLRVQHLNTCSTASL